jgi:mono/diheme cytochrome c family protein/YHS domain-containing protein
MGGKLAVSAAIRYRFAMRNFAVAALLSVPMLAQQAAIDFVKDVAPILFQRCAECHGEKLQKGDLRLDRKEHLFGADEAKWLVKPGKPDESDLLRRIKLPLGDDDVMPNKGETLSAAQIAKIEAWIASGASWPAAGDEFFVSAYAARVIPILDFGIASPATAAQAKIDAALSLLLKKGVVAARIAADTPAVDVNASLVGAEFGDADMALLQDLSPVLVWLNLARTSVGDAGLQRLAGFAQLRRLNIANTAVGDAGVSQLKGLDRLEVVNLYGSKVTDAGLQHVAMMPVLQKVYAFSTAITADGAAAAVKLRTGLLVDRGEYATERLLAAAAEIAARETAKQIVNELCPVQGKPVDPSTAIEHEGVRVAFCCKNCQAEFQKEPAKFAAKLLEVSKAAAPKVEPPKK